MIGSSRGSAWTVYLLVTALLLAGLPLNAATWIKVTNPAPHSIQIMIQMTDGSIMAQSYDDSQTWMKLTPDATGSYINGTWTPLAASHTARLYFASQVLPDGRLFTAGEEYTGPALLQNLGNLAEIYDPVANTWTSVAPLPPQAGCPQINYASANVASGSPVLTNVFPQTAGLTVGWTVSGAGIPGSTTIVSVDSSTQITLSQSATSNHAGSEVDFNHNYQLSACLGDEPSMLLNDGSILVGDLINQNTWIYSPAGNNWTLSGPKVYTDQSDEEGWAKQADGTIITYDLFKSIATGGSYAEKYNPATSTWSGISPSDGSANGTIPQLSSSALGFELGPIIRLLDGRVLVIGANQHTGIYTPGTNTWAAGPDISGSLNGHPAPFGADDAPAAILPNGHVIFAADAGPSPVTSNGHLTNGSSVITGITSTALLQVGWSIAFNGVNTGAVITGIISSSQIQFDGVSGITATGSFTFGGIFSNPTQLFDFNPTNNTISPVSPALPDANLTSQGAFPSRMLMLPTGQLMFSDGSNQAWIYTPDGSASLPLRPVINGIVYNGGGQFTLTGKQLNGQSAGAAYGDDDQMDSNYPILRLTSAAGNVYYCKTTNWSTTGVATGTTPETVNFTLNPALPAGNYTAIVSGAGIASLPYAISITQAEVNGQ